jgi:DNA polymerase-3 subunit epsilon
MLLPKTKKFQDLLFVDTETTGLDPTKHEILEVAAIRTTPDAKQVLTTYHAKIKPLRIETAEPKALEINKYSAEEWTFDKCVNPEVVVRALMAMSHNTVLVGHNVSFDEGFLTALLRQFYATVPWGYHKIDTVALAWPLFMYTPAEGVSLEKVCRYLGTTNKPEHRAMNDALACRDVYLSLMSRWEKACEA